MAVCAGHRVVGVWEVEGSREGIEGGIGDVDLSRASQYIAHDIVCSFYALKYH